MRVLIVTARFPQVDGKGDQQRGLQFAQLLSREHDVRLITTGRPPASDRASFGPATISAVRVSLVQRATGAIAALLSGRPAQGGWMMPARAYRAVARAAGDADVVIVVTIRCLRTPLPAVTILDHVDTLSVNMAQRAALERNPLVRAAALIEARLLARHERRVARWVAAQLVVSPIDAAALPRDPRPIVMPLVLAPPTGGATGHDPAAPETRDIDVILTGDMRYPPNRDAAEWLVQEIAPRLRTTHPDARIVIAGRAAATLNTAPGIEVMSDVPDLGAVLRRSRVAAVALRRGTGTPIKVHEAVAAGAAVVATPWVADALGAEIDTATDAPGFAAAIARLLDDEAHRRGRTGATRAGLARSSPDAVARQLAELLAVVNVV